jgi:hypothetical protein
MEEREDNFEERRSVGRERRLLETPDREEEPVVFFAFFIT